MCLWNCYVKKFPLMWIHSKISPKCNILPYHKAVAQMMITGRRQTLTYFCKEPDIIVQPFKGTIDSHYPQDRLIKFWNVRDVIFPKMTSLQPLYNALLIFTDGSSKGRAGYLINNQQVIIETPGLSAQLAELTAVLKVFSLYMRLLISVTGLRWSQLVRWKSESFLMRKEFQGNLLPDLWLFP